MDARRVTVPARCCVILIAVGAATLVASPVRAQQFPPNNEFGVWGSYSANSPDVYTSQGHIQFGVAAFRYGRMLVTSPSYTVEYTIDVDPVEVARANVYESCQIFRGGMVQPGFCAIGHQWIYGGGVSPFGWKFNLRPGRQWQPFGALSCGFVMSQRAIPDDIPKATRFNFTFDFQVGMEHFNRSRTRAWTFSYKLQHISNGFRSTINPGVDLNMIAVGYSFFK
ncbi:MAG: acyloxyacyl hydrolase [Candidatus Acidiferrales bacterium]